MSKPHADTPPRDARRRSIWLARWWYVLPVLVAIGVFLPRLYAHVQAARERARNEPHVSSLGQGSATHLTVWIIGTGNPASEVNLLVGEAVGRFVADVPPREITFAQWAKGKGLAHSRGVQLCISVSQLSASALGRLHEIPRTDGVSFCLYVETSEVSADGVRALMALRNLNSIVIRGCQMPVSTAAALIDALPNCVVDVEAVDL
jgi:hypothetical protein